MRRFDEDTSWDAARRDVRYTKAALQARKAHPAALAATQTLLTQWKTTDDAWTEAEDAVTDANAGVALADFTLDQSVRKLAETVKYAYREGGDAVIAAYFPVAPSEVIALGLESEIDRAQRFFIVAKEHTPPAEVASVLTEVESACAAGREALAARITASEQEARVLLRVRQWKESANAARFGIENQLDAYAIEQRLPRNYSDAFFVRGRGDKGRKAKRAEEPKPAPEK